MGDAAAKLDKAFSGDFGKDVPMALQDDTLQRIVEVAWGYSEDAEISIDDIEQLNALNIEITGTITIAGQEHSFHIKDGNNNGTEILSWNADVAIRRDVADPLSLIPMTSDVRAAVNYNRGEAFLEGWERDKSGTGDHGEALSKLPSAQAYDAFFAPGTGVGRHYRDKAAKFGYQIGHESDALAVRKTLIASVFKALPSVSRDATALSEADPAELLASWAVLQDPDSKVGASIKGELTRMTERMSRDLKLEPTKGELEALAELGAVPARRGAEVALRGLLWSRMISFEPIEGFDRLDLPENPIAELFKVFDSEMVGCTKVIPEREIAHFSEALVSKMSRGELNAVDDAWFDAAARVGYRLVVNSDQQVSVPSDSMEP